MNAADGLALLLNLLGSANAIGQLLSTAQAQGRDITPEELQSVVNADDAARAALVSAIAAARGALVPPASPTAALAPAAPSAVV